MQASGCRDDVPVASTSTATSAADVAISTVAKKVRRPTTKQRSCDGCRIRKVACSYRTEAEVARARPPDLAGDATGSAATSSIERPPCRACKTKDLRCVITNEDVPFKRTRVGKNLRKAMALHGSASSSSGSSISQSSSLSPIASISTSTEQLLNLTALSGKLGHHLISVCVDRPHAYMDRPPFCPPIFDQWGLQTQFEAAGGRLSQLAQMDQLLCSIMLAFGMRKIPDDALGSYSREEGFKQLCQRAEGMADQTAIWRKADPESISVLVLLSQLMSDGDLTSKAGRQYRRVALASLDEIAPVASLIEDRDAGYNCFLPLLLIDAASALEAGHSPLMQQSVVDQFTRSRGLPDPAYILELSRKDNTEGFGHLSQETGIECLVTINGVCLEHAGLVLRMVADYASMLRTTPAMANEMAHTLLWGHLDSLETWLDSVKSLVNAELYTSLYLEMVWCVRLIAEASIGKALATATVSMCMKNGLLVDMNTMCNAIQASNISKRRLQSALLSYAKGTAFNGHQINSLSLFTGTFWSVESLKSFTACFAELFTERHEWAATLEMTGYSNWLQEAEDKTAQVYGARYPAMLSASTVRQISGTTTTYTPDTTLEVLENTTAPSYGAPGWLDLPRPGASSLQPSDSHRKSSELDLALMDSWIDWMALQT